MTTEDVFPGPTGVVPPGHPTITLPENGWLQAKEIVRAKTGRLPPSEFRKALDDALQVWKDAKYLQEQSTSKQVRENLKRATGAALRLNDRLNDLDGNSRQLLGEIPGGSISELYGLVTKVALALAKAETKAHQFPRTRKGTRDYPSLNMGRYLALGLKWHLGQEATSSENGLFAPLYAVLANVVKVSSDGKAIRAAIKYISEHPLDESDGLRPVGALSR